MTGRLPQLDLALMNSYQQEVFDSIAGGPRGGVRGPFLSLLHRPEFADAVQNLGRALRFEGDINPRMREFIILTVAAHWDCAYEWEVHERDGRKAGLTEVEIAAIKVGRLAIDKPPYPYLHKIIRSVLSGHWDDETEYTKVLEAIGPGLLVEVYALVGYYSMLALMINGHRIPPAIGS